MGFPTTPEDAVSWARSAAFTIDKPDDWIREVWHQAVARDFLDGAGVRIVRWTHFLAARARKPDSFRDSEGGSLGSQKKYAAKKAHPLDVEPAEEWRSHLQVVCDESGITVGDLSTIAWREVPEEYRQKVVDRLNGKKGGAS